MSGFKETEIGLVPESWDIVPLEQTGKVVYGIQAAVANLTKPIGTKILTNINITFDGKINLNQLRYYPLTKARHFKAVLEKGDILFNWRSGSKDHVGKTAFFDLDGEFTHSSFILRIRTNDKVVNKYLFYYLTHLRSSGYFRKLQNYSVNAKFNASAVNALPTAVPPYKEQQNITHILSKIQSAIEAQEKIIQTTTELKKALMQKLFTEGLRGEPQRKDSALKWDKVKLGSLTGKGIVEFQNGFPCGQWNESGVGIPQLRPFNVTDFGKIDLTQIKSIETNKSVEKYKLKQNDIVFNNTNSEVLVGKTALWQNGDGYVLSNHMTIIRIKDNTSINPTYLANFYIRNGLTDTTKWFVVDTLIKQV